MYVYYLLPHVLHVVLVLELTSLVTTTKQTMATTNYLNACTSAIMLNNDIQGGLLLKDQTYQCNFRNDPSAYVNPTQTSLQEVDHILVPQECGQHMYV